jgi:hypothetical protein
LQPTDMMEVDAQESAIDMEVDGAQDGAMDVDKQDSATGALNLARDREEQEALALRFQQRTAADSKTNVRCLDVRESHERLRNVAEKLTDLRVNFRLSEAAAAKLTNENVLLRAEVEKLAQLQDVSAEDREILQGCREVDAVLGPGTAGRIIQGTRGGVRSKEKPLSRDVKSGFSYIFTLLLANAAMNCTREFVNKFVFEQEVKDFWGRAILFASASALVDWLRGLASMGTGKRANRTCFCNSTFTAFPLPRPFAYITSRVSSKIGVTMAYTAFPRTLPRPP